MKEFMTYLPYILIAVAAIALIIFACYIPKMLRTSRLKKQGRVGEEKVATILKKYALMRDYKVINDISIPLYDGCTQIDHILIGTFGLLLIETKSHKGDIYAEPREKEWVHIIGGKKQRIYNPLLQNKAHIDALRYQLQKNKVYKVPVEAVVVFSAEKKKNLYIEKGHPIIEIENLKKFLHQERFERDNGVDVQKLYNFLKSIEVTDPKILKEHDKFVASKK